MSVVDSILDGWDRHKSSKSDAEAAASGKAADGVCLKSAEQPNTNLVLICIVPYSFSGRAGATTQPGTVGRRRRGQEKGGKVCQHNVHSFGAGTKVPPCLAPNRIQSEKDLKQRQAILANYGGEEVGEEDSEEGEDSEDGKM